MQFRRVSIKAFRGIQDLEFYDLGRINLLVGQNNCGKTSVLEAMHVLGNYSEKGGFSYSSRINDTNNNFHAISDYYVPIKSKEKIFFISSFEAITVPIRDPTDLISIDLKGYYGLYTGLYFKKINSSSAVNAKGKFESFKQKNSKTAIEQYYSTLQEFDEDVETRLLSLYKVNKKIIDSQWNNISTFSSKNLADNIQLMDLHDNYQQIVAGVDNAVAKGIKKRLVKVLHQLDSEITDIDVSTSKGVLISLQETIDEYSNPIVPLEYFGAATIRMLTLLIKLSECRDGMLMIDEIDTAMHYSHLKLIWETLLKGAEEFNVQVFVTTHSDECVKALAELLRDRNEDNFDRIETESVRMYHIHKYPDKQMTQAFKYDAHHIASLCESPFIEYR